MWTLIPFSVSFVPEDSPQEVPDLDLHPSMFSGSSDLEYDLVPEYADLGIIYNEDIGKVSTPVKVDFKNPSIIPL